MIGFLSLIRAADNENFFVSEPPPDMRIIDVRDKKTPVTIVVSDKKMNTRFYKVVFLTGVQMDPKGRIANSQGCTDFQE